MYAVNYFWDEVVAGSPRLIRLLVYKYAIAEEDSVGEKLLYR